MATFSQMGEMETYRPVSKAQSDLEAQTFALFYPFFTLGLCY